MIELLANVCLVASPAQCKDVHLTYAADGVTPHLCMMFGQGELMRIRNGGCTSGCVSQPVASQGSRSCP